MLYTIVKQPDRWYPSSDEEIEPNNKLCNTFLNTNPIICPETFKLLKQHLITKPKLDFGSTKFTQDILKIICVYSSDHTMAK